MANNNYISRYLICAHVMLFNCPIIPFPGSLHVSTSINGIADTALYSVICCLFEQSFPRIKILNPGNCRERFITK